MMSSAEFSGLWRVLCQPWKYSKVQYYHPLNTSVQYLAACENSYQASHGNSVFFGFPEVLCWWCTSKVCQVHLSTHGLWNCFQASFSHTCTCTHGVGWCLIFFKGNGKREKELKKMFRLNYTSGACQLKSRQLGTWSTRSPPGCQSPPPVSVSFGFSPFPVPFVPLILAYNKEHKSIQMQITEQQRVRGRRRILEEEYTLLFSESALKCVWVSAHWSTLSTLQSLNYVPIPESVILWFESIWSQSCGSVITILWICDQYPQFDHESQCVSSRLD